MKKCCWILVLALLLTGCGSVQTFETLGAIPQQPLQQPTCAQVLLELPEDAAQDVFEGEKETLYSCQDYTICLQTFEGGDIPNTVKSVSGYDPDKLMVMESMTGNVNRYDWVWTAVGEDGDMIGRAAVLDDGNFHYCLSVLASADKAGALSQEWNGLFHSFRLET